MIKQNSKLPFRFLVVRGDCVGMNLLSVKRYYGVQLVEDSPFRLSGPGIVRGNTGRKYKLVGYCQPILFN